MREVIRKSSLDSYARRQGAEVGASYVWVLAQLGGASLRGDAAVLEDDRTACDAERRVHVLLDEQHRDAGAIDRFEYSEDRVDDLGGEAERRLVEDQELRIRHQRP